MDTAQRHSPIFVIITSTVVLCMFVVAVYIIIKGYAAKHATSIQIEAVGSSRVNENKQTSSTLTGSPIQSYITMRTAFARVKTLDDYVAFMDIYQTKESRKAFVTNFDQVGMTQDAKEKLFAQIKELLDQSIPRLSDITRIEATINDDTATLLVFANKDGAPGTVTLIKENGEWRTQSEVWRSKEANVSL